MNITPVLNYTWLAHEFGKYGITVNAYAPGMSTLHLLN